MPPAIAVDRIDAATALTHWEAADAATVFTHPEILSAFAPDVHWWLATEAGRPACLWPVCVDHDGHMTRTEFGYYVGPVELGLPEPSPRRRLLRSVAIQHALLAVLTKAYASLRWSTRPGQHDLRPWQWFKAEGRSLSMVPRQTAVLNGLDRLSDSDLLDRFSRTRRYEFRLAEKGGAVILPGIRDTQVQSLYLQTLAAKGAGKLAQRRLGAVESLCALVSKGHGFHVTCGIGGDGVARATWVVLVAKGRACEVLGAADSVWRDRTFNAYGRFHSMIGARARGVSCYDFNGANSLHLGADKHSYGAEAHLYFDMSL